MSPPLELWAGPECTVARLHDRYVDQIELTGHGARLDDLDRFAALGVRALRYPVLWERTAPHGLAGTDWSWPDERLARLRELRVRPIVGLVHHGSGPPSTSLLDAAFPQKLAGYARAVAERYPWVREWTPVNEPLTTARFSALYGHWYPHARDTLAFTRALLNQCRGVVLAMRAIREVVRDARLVQTDDLGKTHSTPLLAYQAEFENERRWLTWDLLCGRRLDPRVRTWLVDAGVDASELEWFRANPCPPDVVGVNHYLSSERFLDERLDRYPAKARGGNGRHAYADVLAARVLAAGPDGPERLLGQAWDRYGIPLAVTEAHNGCTREEQLRWLAEVWEAAEGARQAGADVRAVTVWSLLGAAGWDTLLADGARYEPGVFDVRAPVPRPTALAGMTAALGNGDRYDHPVLGSPGWWRRPLRLWYPAVGAGSPRRWRRTARPLLVTGKTGTLGHAFARVCELRGLEHRVLARADLDIADADGVAAVLDELRPWALVNTAGYVRVDEAEDDAARCARENSDGPAALAEACARKDVRLVTFSSDLVFDGEKAESYVESDPVAPLSVYGATKADGERRVLAASPSALVVRTAAFFGPWDRHNFVTLALGALRTGAPFAAADDSFVSPTYVPDLVDATLDLLIDGESGIWHLANAGAVSWAELAVAAARFSGVPDRTLRRRRSAELGLRARRPRWSVLGSARGQLLPPLEDALSRYVREHAAA